MLALAFGYHEDRTPTHGTRTEVRHDRPREPAAFSFSATCDPGGKFAIDAPSAPKVFGYLRRRQSYGGGADERECKPK
jgi:hypothetical protein